MKRDELISAVKAKDKRAYMGYRGIETPPEVILAVVNDAIAAEREALLVEIESTFPTQEKQNPDDDEKFPLCDEYNCDGRLHKLIAKIRESRQP